jgi:hypothetical protein
LFFYIFSSCIFNDEKCLLTVPKSIQAMGKAIFLYIMPIVRMLIFVFQNFQLVLSILKKYGHFTCNIQRIIFVKSFCSKENFWKNLWILLYTEFVFVHWVIEIAIFLKFTVLVSIIPRSNSLKNCILDWCQDNFPLKNQNIFCNFSFFL